MILLSFVSSPFLPDFPRGFCSLLLAVLCALRVSAVKSSLEVQGFLDGIAFGLAQHSGVLVCLLQLLLVLLNL